MQGRAWGGRLGGATFHAGAWVLCSLPLAKAADALNAGRGRTDRVTLAVSESTPQSMQLLLSQSFSCSRGCWGKAFSSSFKSKKGHRRSFNLCQSLKHVEDLPPPTPFCPQHRVHGPPSLLSRRHGDTGQAQAGKKQSQCLHWLRHEPLDAAEGALDHSCHLVSSFGSESQLTADPACLAGANASLPSPPSQRCSSRLTSTSPCREKGEQTPSERASTMELTAGAMSGWRCCSENHRQTLGSSGGMMG